MSEKSKRNHWQEALAFKQLLQMGSGGRLPNRGERVRRSDELDEQERKLKADREQFDDWHAETKAGLESKIRRLELVWKVCDKFVDDLLPDYVRLLRQEDETLDLLERLQRVLKPSEIPFDLKAELAKREETGETSARKAHYAEALGVIMQMLTGTGEENSSESEEKSSKPAKRRKPKSSIEDIEDAVRDAVAEHEPDPAA